MSVSAVVAAGSALALYYVGRRGGACAGDTYETHQHAHSAPTSFLDDLYFLAEGLRYTYGETLGRWRTADLLIGLAYLCRKDPEEHPVTDIAQLGRPYGRDLTPEQWPAALAELRDLERFFRYCSGLRERRPVPQRQYFRRVLGVTDEDLLAQELRAGVLKPSYVLIRDRQLHSIVLAIRGTHSFKDMFTSLTGASKPHHLVDANGVVLGYSHFGMLAAARWIKGQTKGLMETALADNPGYRLRIIGHSLGGGTAALLTMMLREAGGTFADVTCVAVACPSCMTLELAQSCGDYVTTVVHGADVIPTICPGSADALREEVMRSSWFREFRRDVRASGIVRAVESSLRGVGTATMTATSWTTSKLAACYTRRPFAGARQRRLQLKRRNSDEALVAAAAEAAAEEATEAAAARGGSGEEEGGGAPLPLSASAPTNSMLSLAAAAEEEAAGGAGGAAWGSRQQHVQQAQHSQQQQQAQQAGEQQIEYLGASWGQRVTSGTSQVLRSTSGLLRRMWVGTATGSSSTALLAEPPGSGAPGGSGVLTEAAAAAAAAAAGSPHRALGTGTTGATVVDEPPSPMVIDDFEEEEEEEGVAEEEEGELMIEVAETAGGSNSGGGGGGGGDRFSFLFERQTLRQTRVEVTEGLQHSGSLEEEASQRMQQVQQAVHEAEDEEAQEAARGLDDSTVPAVIRPGSYGVPGASSATRLSPSKADPQWRRQMYPAGRILHLVPARLVPGTPAFQAAAAAAEAAAAVEAAEAAVAETEDEAATAMSEAKAGAAGAAVAEVAAAAGDGRGGGAPPAPGRAKHAAQLSMSDLIAGEGLMSRRVSIGAGVALAAVVPEAETAGGEEAAAAAGSGGGAQAPAAGQQAQQVQQEEMVLLEGVPQEAYARIKLCKSVLRDHIIPNYLRALESALVGVHQQAGLPPPATELEAQQEQQTGQHAQQQPQQTHEPARGGASLPVVTSPAAASAAAVRATQGKVAPVRGRSGKQD